MRDLDRLNENVTKIETEQTSQRTTLQNIQSLLELTPAETIDIQQDMDKIPEQKEMKELLKKLPELINRVDYRLETNQMLLDTFRKRKIAQEADNKACSMRKKNIRSLNKKLECIDSIKQKLEEKIKKEKKDYR
jgi:hypothetical protein